MSEEFEAENVDNIQDGLDQEPSESIDNDSDNIQDTPEYNAAELAAKKGHLSYEDYIAKGGKPELYKSPEVFLALEEPLKEIRNKTKRLEQQERDFERRMENMRKFHDAQLEAQKKELIAKRNEAVEDGDIETFNNIQNKIDGINRQEVEPQNSQPARSQVVEDWSNDPKNAWIDQPGPKSTYAQSQFQHYLRSGLDEANAIASMERDIAREFPDVNRNAQNAPIPEKGTPAGRKQSFAKATMNNLTPEEQKIWDTASSVWGNNEKLFLETVNDNRRAAKNG